MKARILVPVTGLLTLLLLGGGLACRPKPNEATVQADPAKAGATPEAANPAPPAAAAPAPQAPAPQPAAAPAAPAPQAPRKVVLEVPAGTRLKVILARELSTGKDQSGAPWEGTLAAAVLVHGQVAWPAGTPVKGVVAQSAAAGRLQGGKGALGIRLGSVGRNDVEAGTYQVVGEARAARNAKIIGGTAALGALVGILTSKHHQGDHALGGAAIGAAAGTGLAAVTADTVIRIPATTPVAFTLSAPAQVALKP